MVCFSNWYWTYGLDVKIFLQTRLNWKKSSKELTQTSRKMILTVKNFPTCNGIMQPHKIWSKLAHISYIVKMNAVFTLITTNFLLFTFLNHSSRRRKGKIGFGRIMQSVKSPRNHNSGYHNIYHLLNGNVNILDY